MRVVILWAGKGRRIQSEYGGIHKAMIPLKGKMLLERILDNIWMAGGDEIVPILGYMANEMEGEIRKVSRIQSIIPVINERYEETNNLYSLMQARNVLENRDFVVVNGDMVFDYRILKKIFCAVGNAVGTDSNDYGFQLDSPRLLIKNNRILDLGRHRTIGDSQGYAIGIYKFSAQFSREYFDLGETMASENPNAGYHDPLVKAFERVMVEPCYTGRYLWMDVDEKSDVSKAEKMIEEIEKEMKE